MKPDLQLGDVDLVKRTLAYRTFVTLLARGRIRRSDSVLVIGAGNFDAHLFRLLDITNVTLSNLNAGNAAESASHVDGGQIPFADEAFDHVMTRSTLHHMSRPHRAIAEMYRVARKSVLFFESEDTLLMRLLLRLKLANDYEFNANLLTGGMGGVDNRPIPNYVYRWSRREVEKVVRSLDPTHAPDICFFKAWEIEVFLRRILKRVTGDLLSEPKRYSVAGALADAANSILPSQANNLGVVILKSGRQLHPWIGIRDGEEVFLGKPART